MCPSIHCQTRLVADNESRQHPTRNDKQTMEMVETMEMVTRLRLSRLKLVAELRQRRCERHAEHHDADEQRVEVLRQHAQLLRQRQQHERELAALQTRQCETFSSNSPTSCAQLHPEQHSFAQT